MIGKMLKDPLSQKRWKVFKSRKTSWIALWFFFFILFLSVTAELWSNSKPLILSHQGSLYFPALKRYSPKEFGIENQYVTNYRRLKLSETDWAIWPLVPWDPYESNLEVDHFPSPPSSTNWMGTDDRGRDVLARLLYGYRYSIMFSICIWFFSYIIGSLLGGLMGYFGGFIDIIGQRFVEIIESLPILVVLITLSTVLGRSFSFLVTFFSLIGWVGISLYMRAEFLRLRKMSFVEASRAMGRTNWGIIVHHIFPNALNPIITFSPFVLASSISYLATLDYLGFGLVPPTPSWGELLSQAEKHFTVAWWLALFPSLALLSTLLSLTLIGNGARDAFDPKELS